MIKYKIYIEKKKKSIDDNRILFDTLNSETENIRGFHEVTRGFGFYFGEDTVDEFNRINKINLIIRSSQLILDGYKEWFNHKLYSIWSAPNFQYRCKNYASIVEIDQYCRTKVKLFENAPTSARLKET